MLNKIYYSADPIYQLMEKIYWSI